MIQKSLKLVFSMQKLSLDKRLSDFVVHRNSSPQSMAPSATPIIPLTTPFITAPSTYLDTPETSTSTPNILPLQKLYFLHLYLLLFQRDLLLAHSLGYITSR